MPKINYYDGRNYLEIEVSEEVATVYDEITQEERREEWRKSKRLAENSIEEMLEAGEEIPDESDFLEDFLEVEQLQDLRNAVNQLNSKEQLLLKKIFDERKTEAEIAKQEGINQSAIANRKARILDKLRKILKNF